jgi:hypothetical protein
VKYENVKGDESSPVNAVIYYVKQTPTPVAAPATTIVNEIIKKYNYVIVNAAGGTASVLPIVLSPAPNSYVMKNQVTVTGTALPNTVVTLHIHSVHETIVKAVTDANGTFVYNFERNEIATGGHEIYASIDQTGGNLVGPAVSFNVIPYFPTETASPASGFIFTGSLLFFLALWFAVIILVFFFMYGRLTGRAINVNFLGEFFTNLSDLKWWRSLPALFVSSLKRIWQGIRSKF